MTTVRIYLLDPELTRAGDIHAANWHAAAAAELEQYLDVIRVSSTLRLAEHTPSSRDAVVVFNGVDQAYNPAVLSFLREANDDGAKIVPVGLDENSLRGC